MSDDWREQLKLQLGPDEYISTVWCKKRKYKIYYLINTTTHTHTRLMKNPKPAKQWELDALNAMYGN